MLDVARVRRSCRVHRTVGAEPRLAFRITTLLRRRALASHEHHSSARLSLRSRIPAKSHLPWLLSGDDDRLGIYLRLQTLVGLVESFPIFFWWYFWGRWEPKGGLRCFNACPTRYLYTL